MNRALGESEGNRMKSTTRRIQSAGNDSLNAFLLVDEAQLTAPLHGTSHFASKCTQRGPRDRLERSLRYLDLQRRLFKYPCSYLIYSPAFEGLPSEMPDYVWQRLWDVLSNSADEHFTPKVRQEIIEILRDTNPGLGHYWTAAVDAPEGSVQEALEESLPTRQAPGYSTGALTRNYV